MGTAGDYVIPYFMSLQHILKYCSQMGQPSRPRGRPRKAPATGMKNYFADLMY
jgi:hypothetical protein